MVEAIDHEVDDVFTSDPFKGNPLAIIELIRGLPDSQKLQIAKEFNFSETVFWHRYLKESTHKIDIWTPAGELPFAGHPVIGGAKSILTKYGITKGSLQVKAGLLNITLSSDGLAHAVIPHDIHQHKVVLNSRTAVWSIVKGMTFALVKLDTLEELAEQTEQIDSPLLILMKDGKKV